MSHLQQLVTTFIKGCVKPTEIRENHRPPWLRGLELDIYMPEHSIAIEVQGKQHSAWMPELQKTVQDHIRQRVNDNLKRRLCEENHVVLIEVSTGDYALHKLHDKLCYYSLIIREPLREEIIEFRKHCKLLRKRFHGSAVRVKLTRLP